MVQRFIRTNGLLLIAFVAAVGASAHAAGRYDSGTVWLAYDVTPQRIVNGGHAGRDIFDGDAKRLWIGAGWGPDRGKWGLWDPATKKKSYSSKVIAGRKTRLVARIDFGKPSAGDERVDLWVDPDGDAMKRKPDASLSMTMSGFDRHATYVADGSQYALGSVRIGKTLGQVAPGAPKPVAPIIVPDVPGDPKMEKLFAVDVLPLLRSKCFACHGDKPDKIKGELNMLTHAGLLKGGEDHGAAIVPGSAAKSPLYVAVTWHDEDLEMPPKENDRLTPHQIALVKKWIDGGAPWPSAKRIAALKKKSWAEPDADGGVIVKTSGGLGDDWTYRRYQPDDLWAYRPVRKPTVPRGVTESDNPIDAFVDRKLAEAKLDAAPPADRRTLIRRATLDLTGLPPTAAEIEAFVADRSPDAYDKLIDRLLASPRYGEQMARHWLDVVRYADSAGFSNDYARPNAWRYRDYVIRAFNADMPYDRFVREQLAGDELLNPTPDQLIAVGFLRMGPWEHTGMSVAAVTRQQFLDDVTNSVGVTFLAHELRCASCHDHKFDPIPTRDYYRMQAIFASIRFDDRRLDFHSDENTAGMEAGAKRIARLKKTQAVKPLTSIPKKDWPVASYDKNSDGIGRGKVNAKRVKYLNLEAKRYEPLVFSVKSGSSEKTHILTGGSIESPAAEVSPGVLSAVAGVGGADEPGEISAVTRATKGRRLALADWIASPAHPLTARVMVNRIWQQHFGRALAANPNNFGRTGAKPTHPELLDYLAADFVARGWSVKHIHRLIVTCEAYRRSSKHPSLERVRQADSDGTLLAVYTPRRLAAEELRDAMLLATGELNPTMGGIPARPEINLEVATQPRHIMGSVAPAYQPSPDPAERHRRTIYAERIRTMLDPSLRVFNQPGPDTSCERRDSSTVTPQVFTLFNSVNSRDRSIALAARIADTAGDANARARSAFHRILGRAPSDAELAQAVAHVQRMTTHHKAHPPVKVQPPHYVIREMVEEQTGLNFYWVEDLDVYRDTYKPDTKPWDVDARTRALADLCLVLFNSNEFIYVY